MAARKKAGTKAAAKNAVADATPAAVPKAAAPKAAVAKAAPDAAQSAAAEPPKPTAATRELDRMEGEHVFRVDMGQSLPTPPIRTATDNEKSSKK